MKHVSPVGDSANPTHDDARAADFAHDDARAADFAHDDARAADFAHDDARAADFAELGLAFRGVMASLRRLRGRDTHLGAGDLSHAQFELLIELHEHGELSAGELASAARLTPATVTQMLDHLAACGHVERARSDVDRRVVVSRLTAQGAGRIEGKRELWQRRWQQALADMDARELRAATRVLTRLRTVFDDAPEAGGCADPK